MHFGRMESPRYIAAGIVLCAALVACGGGGGGGTTPSTTSTPIVFPTASTTPATATASGVLVDHETGTALAGILGWSRSQTPPAQHRIRKARRQRTVRSRCTHAPGTYLLVIGNDTYPDASNRPTIHDMVTLTPGANSLTAPKIGPAPGATANPIEYSGKFRLTTLTSAEQACLALENSTRQSHGLSTVVSDEWLTEDHRGYWSVATTTNSFPQDPNVLTNYNSGDGNGQDCSDMINSGFVLGWWMSYAQTAYFDGDNGGAHNVATSEGMVDPRATPYPSPSPSHPWP